MAVANACPQKEWEEWKQEMEENRRRRWKEWVRRLAKVEVSDEKEEGVDRGEDAEAEDTDCEGEGVSEDKEEEENGAGEKKEEKLNKVMEENQRRRWREKVSRWAKVEVSNEEEEGEEVEAEDTDCEEEEVSEDKEEEESVPSEKKEEKWKKVMEENQRRSWRNRVSHWAMVEVKNEEKEGEEAEAEHKDCEEEEVSEDKQEDEHEAEEKEEDQEGEMEMREAEEMEEEGKYEVQRGVKEIKRGDEEEEREVVEGDERVDMEEEEKEEENGVEREVEENDEVDVEEEKEVTKAEEVEEGKEKGENELEREVKDNDEVDMEEEKEVTIADVEEGKEEGQNEFEWEVKEAEERQEGENEVEIEIKVKVNEEVDEEEYRQVRKEEQVEEEDDEHREIGQYHQAEQFREQRIEDENIQQHHESSVQEDKTVNEEDNLSGSVEPNDSDLMESEDEYYNFERMKDDNSEQKDPVEMEDADGKPWRDENSTLGAWTSVERKEEENESEKLTDEKETVAESWSTKGEEFQDDHKKLQEEEEESTDDEEAEHSADKDADSYDEDVVKIYRKDDYFTDVFHTLTEFRDSSLLTDLTLSTVDGKSFHVHSPVLAAVSSHIRKSLSRSIAGNAMRVDEKKDDDASVGVYRPSVSLGPEVDHVGLEAVVEFAYTGLITCLNKDTVHQITAAAQTLDAPRVLDLCAEEEGKATKTGGMKKEEGMLAAEQMRISLHSIRQLWLDRVGCDAILEALGGSLHIHRVILAVWSDYFRSMFTLGMRESHQTCVSLPFLLASELEVLIDCSYSGALPLSWRCIFEITSTALQLQYQPALSLCLNFLHQEINPDSCLDVASFAEAYEMEQLLEVADDFVLRQFQKVACTSKFKDLPAKQLLKYLNSPSLCVPSELVVFKAVVAWIQAKPKKRLKLAKELMKTIHFPLMLYKEFKEVQSLNMWSDHSLAELYEAVFEDFCSNETAPQSQYRSYMPKESLVLIGGDQTSEDLGRRSISRELWFGNSLRNHTGIRKTMEWRRLGDMPEPERYRHEVALLNGQLYVTGGKKYYGISDTLNSVYRYDPLQNNWESLAEMQEKRCSFSLVVLDGKMYAIGGHCDPAYIDSVERYCPTANSWSFTRPLDLPLSGHVAKALQGQIFVSGGLSSDYQYLASMFLYHPETGSTYLANMAKPRAYHCMESLGACLYVAGGITKDDNMAFLDHLACEVYNPVANSWTAFTSLPVPHVGAGSAVLEGKFYVLGGYSQEDYSDIKMVHRYDPTTQRWENMGKMPGPNNDIRASVLCLPQHLRL